MLRRHWPVLQHQVGTYIHRLLCEHKEIRVETSLASVTAPGRDVHPRVIMSLRVQNVFAGQGYVILFGVLSDRPPCVLQPGLSLSLQPGTDHHFVGLQRVQLL